MSVLYYNGAASTTYTDVGNWVGGAAPSSGDSVIILAACANNIAGSDQTAVLLVSFIVQEGVEINIGSSGTKLQIACDKFSFKGSCPEAWIALRDGNGAGAVTQVDIHGGYAPLSDETLEGLHLSSVTTDTMSPCRVHAGTVSFDATSRIPALVVNGGTAYVLSATGITTAVVNAGTVEYSSTAAITTLTIGANASWYHLVLAGDVTTVNTHGGLYWADGDITTLNAHEGTVDFTDLVRRVTVGTLNLYNASVDERNATGSPTYSNPINVLGLGIRYIDPANTITTTMSLTP